MTDHIKKGIQKDDPFVRVPNETAQDETLSWKARGLLLYLLSLPGNWEVKVSHLKDQSPVGRDGTKTGLNELMDAGYITREQQRREDGTMGPMCYKVSNYRAYAASEPETENPEPASSASEPETEKPSTAEPSTAEPSTEKPQLQTKHSTNETGQKPKTEQTYGDESNSPPPEKGEPTESDLFTQSAVHGNQDQSTSTGESNNPRGDGHVSGDGQAGNLPAIDLPEGSEWQPGEWQYDLAVGFLQQLRRFGVVPPHIERMSEEELREEIQEWAEVHDKVRRNRGYDEDEVRLMYRALFSEGNDLHEFWVLKENLCSPRKLNRRSSNTGEWYVDMIWRKVRALVRNSEQAHREQRGQQREVKYDDLRK